MTSLRAEVHRFRNSPTLPARLVDKINDRYTHLQTTYGIHYNPLILSIASNPQLATDPSISSFFRRPFDVWIENRGSTNIAFDLTTKCWIDAARVDYKIGLRNANGQNEIWSRLNSISDLRRDHHPNSSQTDKSRFLRGVDYIKEKEFQVFNKGIGILRGNVLNMFLGFNDIIGEDAPNRNRRPLNYVRLKCERKRRKLGKRVGANGQPRKEGYEVEVHGFPVSTAQITKYLRGKGVSLSNVPTTGTA